VAWIDQEGTGEEEEEEGGGVGGGEGEGGANNSALSSAEWACDRAAGSACTADWLASSEKAKSVPGAAGSLSTNRAS
jgi:hypothetical protein